MTKNQKLHRLSLVVAVSAIALTTLAQSANADPAPGTCKAAFEVGAGPNRDWILSQLPAVPYTPFGLADWDRDGNQDIIARQDDNGYLWLYPGQSIRGMSSAPRVLIGWGWKEYTAFGVGDWDLDDLARLVAVGEQALAGLDLEMHVGADELQMRVAHQGAGQQARFGDDLEAVADRQYRHALRRALLHLGHHRRLRRHGAAAQIVAVGEAAGDHDQVGLFEISVAMPDHLRLAAGDELDRLGDVALAVGAGEDEDSGFHQISSIE